ncbi:hypothetical protein FIBSPDRAFT_395620 [Athelia psychrophila]|uniref:Uncharacterized protein n=1 Tax=Athelia psychrophila TaxID=1759441 RepID=A0A166NNB2_9AGAM|nr:hypothetical protein FIBSPDRAFT_395620 [Fibularhizoctonia sp. CBS 109695]
MSDPSILQVAHLRPFRSLRLLPLYSISVHLSHIGYPLAGLFFLSFRSHSFYKICLFGVGVGVGFLSVSVGVRKTVWDCSCCKLVSIAGVNLRFIPLNERNVAQA